MRTNFNTVTTVRVNQDWNQHVICCVCIIRYIQQQKHQNQGTLALLLFHCHYASNSKSLYFAFLADCHLWHVVSVVLDLALCSLLDSVCAVLACDEMPVNVLMGTYCKNEVLHRMITLLLVHIADEDEL